MLQQYRTCKNRHNLRYTLISTVLLLFFTTSWAQSLTDARVLEQERSRGIVSLYEAITPLRSVTSFMTLGAHPDDERSSQIALLSRGLGVRSITLTATRGEGGQNSIGTDYQQALGVLRSREMEEASSAFDVELFFLSENFDDPIFDFGFSKSAVETLEVWNKDILMEKVVRAIRESRPDILFTNFQNVLGQHGHHRAMTIATEQAYELAGNPEAFPEQLATGLRPWAPRKLYFPAGTGSDLDEEELPTTLSLDVGDFDTIFGATYAQLGEQSRAYHQSQDMGQWREEGPDTAELSLIHSHVSDAESDNSLFTGLPHTVASLAELVDDPTLQEQLRSAGAAIDSTFEAFPDFGAVHTSLVTALNDVRAARETLASLDTLDEELSYDLDFRLGIKEDELQYASRSALALIPRVTVMTPELTRGGSTEVIVTAYLGGETPVENVELDLVAPEGWQVERLADEDGETAAGTSALEYGQTIMSTFLVTVADDAPFYNPYQRYAHPFKANGDIYGVLSYEVDGTSFESTVDDENALAPVLPDISLQVTPENLVHNLLRPDTPVTIEVAATNYVSGPAETTLEIEAPEGWTVEPEAIELSFELQGDARGASFTITPPENVEPGSYDFQVRADGEYTSSEYVDLIEYDHIGRTYLVTPARANLQAFEVAFNETLRVGYVASGSDLVYEGLRRIGMQVDLLTEGDLTTGNLDQYDTIMVGIYGYRARPDLLASNSRLMSWVENGGNLIVQYHRPRDNWDPNSTPPRFIELGSVSFLSRVTDETAPVEILEPKHPLITTPNRLSQADFDGWIKERGLYFAEDWDERYTSLFSITDRQWPDTGEETPFLGSLLTTEIGEGRYTYTSLILHTEIESNVPGAYRIYANLITPPSAETAEAND